SSRPLCAPGHTARLRAGGLGSRAPPEVADGRTMSDMATILVVDDDPIVRACAVRCLERDGHRTLVAGEGNRADELLRQESLDLVVLDVMLPGRDGLALSRSLPPP